MESYQISSKTGVRHSVAGDMPDNMTALQMLKGKDLPTTACGRQLQPVNFYKASARSLPRYQCSRCFPEA